VSSIEENIIVILYYLSGLRGGMSSIEVNILVILYYPSSLIGGMSSIEENILVILYNSAAIMDIFPVVSSTFICRLFCNLTPSFLHSYLLIYEDKNKFTIAPPPLLFKAPPTKGQPAHDITKIFFFNDKVAL
jgi:hypothetical protein